MNHVEQLLGYMDGQQQAERLRTVEHYIMIRLESPSFDPDLDA